MTRHIWKDPEGREAIIRLLAVKDSQIRIDVLEQGLSAVDRGIHAGGAMSAVTPLIALYYGGVMDFKPEHPTGIQDLFVLSKGHAVATLASLYADLGYFDKELLLNSRSRDSLLNGHPGPLLPGVHIPTGPMGQGICVAGGFALAGREEPRFDVFVLTGDGELQEGTVWESVMYTGATGLENLCVMVDRNHGQLDDPWRNVFPMKEPGKQFEAFGFRVAEVDARSFGSVMDALVDFKYGKRDGRSVAVILNCEKGQGTFGRDFMKHKLTLDPGITAGEIDLHRRRLEKRKAALTGYLDRLNGGGGDENLVRSVMKIAEGMNIRLDAGNGTGTGITTIEKDVVCRKAPPREKAIRVPGEPIPLPEKGKQYQASDIVTAMMKSVAADPRIVSIDADLGSTSGLFGGVGAVDRSRALNVGIAEANMMCIGEAYAVLGYNAWVSTFCPFFNWNVLRRIAVNQQERMEVIDSGDGWLSEGHTLDLTFLATASNFDTKTNGATHMGNDDLLVFREVGHLKIIDISCPLQLMEVMKWILEGNRGLVYLRIMRAPSGVLYDGLYRFEYGKGYVVRSFCEPEAVIVSSGRGVHEALVASALLEGAGILVQVVDMPSIDPEMLCLLARGSLPVVFAEQNNGYIWASCSRILLERGIAPSSGVLHPVNTSGEGGAPRYVHSGTYKELLDEFHLGPEQLAQKIQKLLS